MANSLVVKMSPELTDDAQYKDFSDIPSYVLTNRNATILAYPGIYTAPTAVEWADVAVVGVGDREEIVINGDMTIANSSSGTLTFENLTFTGSNADATSGSVCVSKLGAASTPLHFRNCVFGNAEHAVWNHAELSFAADATQVILDYCDATSTDQAVRANANAEINFCALNTSSNSYFQSLGGASGSPTITVTVRASTSGGSNAGNHTETVLGLIS